MNYLSNSMQEPVSSFDLSPPHSNSSADLDDTHSSSLLYDDDAGKDLFEEYPEEPVKPKKSNGRKGNTPAAADKRATHNAIERARRETLNGRFMTLAEALPSMAKVKRPSKSIIVNKALDFVYEAQIKEHALVKENNELRLQVDQLRARLGMPPLPPPAPLPGCAVAPVSPAESAKEKKESPKPVPAGKIPSPSPSFEEFPSRATTIQQQEEAYSPSAPGILEQQQTQQLTQQPSPLSSEHSAPSPVFAGLPLPSQAPNLNAFHAGVMTSSSPTALSPFQLGGFPSGAQVATPPQSANAINPSQSLLAQQHSLLLAAHLQQQQQQQMHFEHLQQHQQYVNGLNMWNAAAHPAFLPQAISVGNGFGGGMDSYAYLA